MLPIPPPPRAQAKAPANRRLRYSRQQRNTEPTAQRARIGKRPRQVIIHVPCCGQSAELRRRDPGLQEAREHHRGQHQSGSDLPTEQIGGSEDIGNQQVIRIDRPSSLFTKDHMADIPHQPDQYNSVCRIPHSIARHFPPADHPRPGDQQEKSAPQADTQRGNGSHGLGVEQRPAHEQQAEQALQHGSGLSFELDRIHFAMVQKKSPSPFKKWDGSTNGYGENLNYFINVSSRIL